MAQDDFSAVSPTLEADDRQGTLRALVSILVRIGGDDLSVLTDLRDELARAVDRLAAVQGQVEDGKPLGTALAPMVRQLLDVLDALDESAGAMPGEESPLDELTAARARRRAGGTATASGL